MPDEAARQNVIVYVMSLLPDICFSPIVPVPYFIIGFFDATLDTATDTLFTSNQAFTTNSRVSRVIGDEAGTGKGLVSFETGGVCRNITSCKTVRVGSCETIRHGDLMEMNCLTRDGQGNTIGMIFFVVPTTFATVSPAGSVSVEVPDSEEDDSEGPDAEEEEEEEAADSRTEEESDDAGQDPCDVEHPFEEDDGSWHPLNTSDEELDVENRRREQAIAENTADGADGGMVGGAAGSAAESTAINILKTTGKLGARLAPGLGLASNAKTAYEATGNVADVFRTTEEQRAAAERTRCAEQKLEQKQQKRAAWEKANPGMDPLTGAPKPPSPGTRIASTRESNDTAKQDREKDYEELRRAKERTRAATDKMERDARSLKIPPRTPSPVLGELPGYPGPEDVLPEQPTNVGPAPTTWEGKDGLESF